MLSRPGPEEINQRKIMMYMTSGKYRKNFGTLFSDSDRVAKRIRDDIAPKVAADAAYQNAKENTPHTARFDGPSTPVRTSCQTGAGHDWPRLRNSNSTREDGSSSAADRLGVRLMGGNAIKQPGADGDPMINAEPSWS